MSDPRQVAAGTALPIGRRNGVLLELMSGDLATVDADLAIVGLCVRRGHARTLGPAAEGLDLALHGAILRLVTDGIFAGHWGETLFLSAPPPPIRAKGVLLLGLGASGRSVASQTRAAMRTAARQAAHLGATHAAFAPARLGADGLRFGTAASTRAVLRGVADALSEPTSHVERWSFVAPPSEAAARADEFRMAFAALWEQ